MIDDDRSAAPATVDDDHPAEPATVVYRARDRVDDVAVDDGAFDVACVETGTRPEPVTDTTLHSLADAAAAAAAAARTDRATLRTLDPDLPTYDLAVYHDGPLARRGFTRRRGGRTPASHRATSEYRHEPARGWHRRLRVQQPTPFCIEVGLRCP